MGNLFGGDEGMKGTQIVGAGDDEDDDEKRTPLWKDILGGVGASMGGNLGLGGGLASGGLAGLLKHFIGK